MNCRENVSEDKNAEIKSRENKLIYSVIKGSRVYIDYDAECLKLKRTGLH